MRNTTVLEVLLDLKDQSDLPGLAGGHTELTKQTIPSKLELAAQQRFFLRLDVNLKNE